MWQRLGPIACPSRSRLAAEPKRMLQATSAAVPELTRPYVVSAFAFSVGISLLVVRENGQPGSQTRRYHYGMATDDGLDKRGWPRSRGHLEGAKAVKACVEACLELGSSLSHALRVLH